MVVKVRRTPPHKREIKLLVTIKEVVSLLEPQKRKDIKINTIRLRVMIGWLGMLLPFIVWYLIGFVPPSISATWYTNACTPFMIILGSASLLLISYRGYEWKDDLLLTATGIFGLMICLFPCEMPLEKMLESILELDGAALEEMMNMDMPALRELLNEMAAAGTITAKELMKLETFMQYPNTQRVGTFMLTQDTSALVHYIAAVLFFALLAINSFFLFTKGSANPTDNKWWRNVIYRGCAIGMLASFLLLLHPDFLIRTWLLEAIALFFFGISFLTKADVYPWLLCDPKGPNDKDVMLLFFRIRIIREEELHV